MTRILKPLMVAAGVLAAAQAHAGITFFERNAFDGRTVTVQERLGNFDRVGFNDSARSAIVEVERWEVCDDVRFGGRCIILRPGRYPNLAAMGMGNRISSARPVAWSEQVDESRYAPPPPEYHGYMRQPEEHMSQANIVDVHAVVGPPEQRCWVERQQVVARPDPAGGAIAGAVIGGIIGHQLIGNGGGTGGAVAGAVIGGNVAANSQPGYVVGTRDIQRCHTVPTGAPDFWDVSYDYGGVVHHVQMTSPPAGATIMVNERGEPRY